MRLKALFIASVLVGHSGERGEIPPGQSATKVVFQPATFAELTATSFSLYGQIGGAGILLIAQTSVALLLRQFPGLIS
jgi:hypothetical protein